MIRPAAIKRETTTVTQIPETRTCGAQPPDPPEIVEVDSPVVSCDGNGGPLGHPRVWLNMNGKGAIDCPYCDRRFVLKPGAGSTPGH
ncbi:MAG: zinc-finger domain-containing protein [Alphaproteobacteria bacterium]|nr:MAG: zinc-finger domain-containing protein [Alphaproteobacteria bacterium]